MVGQSVIDAYWTPGLDESALTLGEREFGPGRIALRLPELSPEHIASLAAALRAARGETLAERPVADIIAALAAAAELLVKPGSERHAELMSALPGVTGYSREMIGEGLRRMGEGWSADALLGALADELGDVGVLDGFVSRRGPGLQRAFGPELSFHIFSGNIPGVSVSSLMRTLVIKSASLGKAARGEPLMAASFARALAEVDPELARCLAVAYWEGGDEALEAAALDAADAAIVYGGDATVASIRERKAPGKKLLAYPNRVGAALVFSSALSEPEDVARGIARDIATFDQQGCVSPHAVFVESKSDASAAEEFAATLAAALADIARELPRGQLNPAESMAIHQVRGAAEMLGARLWVSEKGTEWTVIYEARGGFELSPLNRVVHVRPVASLDAAVAALAPYAEHLQTVAVAGDENEILEAAERLGAIGATRIAAVGDAGWPSPNWHHDGRFQFLDLLRFTDVERR